MTDRRRQTDSWLFAARNLFWWIFALLVAIGLLQFNPFAGLGAALIGGVVLGVLLFK